MNFLTDILSQYVYKSDYEIIPSEIISHIKKHLLDTIGCCYAGLKLDSMKALRNYVILDGGEAQASALGLPYCVPAMQAAFINGSLARSIEFDDIFMPDLHPSGVVIPVALAIGEWMHSTGKEFVSAVGVGLEMCCRLSAAAYDPDLKNSAFNQRGQDASGLCGIIAAAALAAKLLGLCEEKIMHAMGIAVSFASGILEANRTGGNIKSLQSGWAAKAAIQAALLAKCGITGPKAALEGRFGFYHSFIDGKFRSEVLIENLGQEWLIPNIRFKPYPSNYYTHTGIDAALQLLKKNIDVDQIISLHSEVAAPMFRTIGEPLTIKQNPQDAYAAKFSAPYTIAATLLGGSGLGLGVDDFTDALVNDPKRKQMMAKITISVNEECNKIFPEHAPTILTVHTSDGKIWKEIVKVNRGSFANPLSDQELAIKFESNSASLLRKEDQRKIIETVFNIEKINKLGELLVLLKKGIAVA